MIFRGFFYGKPRKSSLIFRGFFYGNFFTKPRKSGWGNSEDFCGFFFLEEIMKNKVIFLWKLMNGNRRLYFCAIVSVLLATLFASIAPLVLRIAIDSIIGNKPIEMPGVVLRFIQWIGGTNVLKRYFACVALSIVLITLMQGIFTYLKGRWASCASEDIIRRLRDKLYNHLQCLPLSFHSKMETGDIIQRCTSDVETIRRFLSIQVVEIAKTLITLGFAIPIMFSLNVTMTLVALAMTPFYFSRRCLVFPESTRCIFGGG